MVGMVWYGTILLVNTSERLVWEAGPGEAGGWRLVGRPSDPRATKKETKCYGVSYEAESRMCHNAMILGNDRRIS